MAVAAIQKKARMGRNAKGDLAVGVLGGNYLNMCLHIHIYIVISHCTAHVHTYITYLGFNWPCTRLGWKFMAIHIPLTVAECN